MRIFLLSIVAAATVLAASPAASQSWRMTIQTANEVRQDINQLERQISRARQRGTISAREARPLLRRAQTVQQLYSRYNRNGLNRDEVARLEREVNQVRAQLRLGHRNWDGRRR